MQIDIEAVQQQIVTQAVERLFDSSGIRAQVKDEIDNRINALFSETVEASIKQQIDDAVKQGFDREYHKVDSFGRPQGEPTTISAELEKVTSRYWQQKVDRNGKDSDGYNTMPRAEWLMLQICSDDFSNQLKQSAVNVVGGLKDGLRNELRRSVDSMLGELFNVRSQQDQKENRSR